MGSAVQNAVEFGRHEKYGGWALGLLVACSVEPDAGSGNRRARGASEKISANAFARSAGTSTGRVSRYYDAWEKAAARAVVPFAARLQPGDVDGYDLPEGYEWEDYYDASQGRASSSGNVIDRLASRVDTQGAAKVVNELPADTRRDLLNALAQKRSAVEDLTPENRNQLGRGIAEAGYVAPDHTHVADTVRRNLNRVLDNDEAVAYGRQAVSALSHAIREKEEDGISDRAGWAKVLADLDRLLVRARSGQRTWSDDDDEFLRAAGIRR